VHPIDGPLQNHLSTSKSKSFYSCGSAGQVDLSGDLVPASSPSALMWAQWAASQQAARVMLDAGVAGLNCGWSGWVLVGFARGRFSFKRDGTVLGPP